MAKAHEQPAAPPKSRREILEALGSYQKKGAFDVQSGDDLVKALQAETDRGFIVVLGSILEDMLLGGILDRLPSLSKTLQKDLTRSGGALGSWSQMINMSLAFGIIEDDDASDFEVFKAMRNACAHSRQHIDFNTPELRDAIGLLLAPGSGSLRSLPSTKRWTRIFRMMISHASRYMVARIGQEVPKRTPNERYRDFADAVRDAPTALPRKRKPRPSKAASQDQTKPKRPRPFES